MSPRTPLPPLQSVLRRPHAGRRALLAACLLVGACLPVYFLALAPDVPLGWDFRAYHAAARAALAGAPFVGVGPGIPGVRYVYPPSTVLLFAPYGALDWRTAFPVHAAAGLGACLALGWLVVRTLDAAGARFGRVDAALIVGFCAASAPALAVLGLGQVDAFAALGLAAVFVALERGRERFAGATLAVVALLKLFPAALGLWLVHRRAWRALAAAAVTGVAAVATGLVCFGPATYRRYLAVLCSRSRLHAYAGTVSPNFAAMSLSRPLSQLLPALDPTWYVPLAGALVAPALWLVASRDGLRDRLATYLVAVAAVVVSPASNALYVVYLYFPVCCLLYLDAGRRPRPLFALGVAALATPVQPAVVAAVLDALPVTAGVATPVVAAVRAAATVASVPLLGVLAVIASLALRSGSRRLSAPAPTSTD